MTASEGSKPAEPRRAAASLAIVGILLLGLFSGAGAAPSDSVGEPRDGDAQTADARSVLVRKTTERYSHLRYADNVLDGEIARFLGKTFNLYSQYGEGPASDQVMMYIAAPDEPFARRLADGGWLVSGFLPHDAATKGAVLLDEIGVARAAAMLVFLGDKVDGSDLHPEIWLYVEKDASAGKYIADIKQWSAFDPKTPIKVFDAKGR